MKKVQVDIPAEYIPLYEKGYKLGKRVSNACRSLEALSKRIGFEKDWAIKMRLDLITDPEDVRLMEKYCRQKGLIDAMEEGLIAKVHASATK